MPNYVVGHKTPDTDSIVAAISLAYLKNKIDEDYIPVRQGEMAPESVFVLDYFGVDYPLVKNKFAGEKVYLVDYSDLNQAPDDIGDATILGIVDHHKLGDITTSTPLECWIRPVGCSNTIIKEMYDFYKIEIPKEIAGIMLCAILSDTVMFKSPTCTKVDIDAVKALADIAQVSDYMAIGLKMINVKSNIKGVPLRDLVHRDYKIFNMNGSKVGVGQLEVLDLSVFDSIKEKLQEEIKIIKEEGLYHTVALLLTDVTKEGSELLFVSNENDVMISAFSEESQDGKIWLDGVLSRKKQIIPQLEEVFLKK